MVGDFCAAIFVVGVVAVCSTRLRLRFRLRSRVREYDAMCGIEFPRITKPLACDARDMYVRRAACGARASASSER